MSHPQRLERLLKKQLDNWTGLAQLAKLCETHRIPAYLFGGFLRDTWVGIQPRDADVALDDTLARRIWPLVEQWQTGVTRFGGVKLQVDGNAIDLWPIGQTWTFREGLNAPAAITRLAETTSFNCEAVVMELGKPPRGRRLMFQHKFFEGAEKRELRVNNPANPYPALMVARAERLAAKLNWTIEPRSAAFLAELRDRLGDEAVAEAGAAHYETGVPA